MVSNTKTCIAIPKGGAAGVGSILPKTVKMPAFNGQTPVTIPTGARMVSDPVKFNLKPMSNPAVTIYPEKGQPTNNITSHPGSRTTSYMVNGDYLICCFARPF